ncbi:MAG: hypothetical protein EOP52_13765 [Sphingobacteriales bacterium]|nr:MAG: hypothetical protein EOP52_13765 [Sphingobacteriales bacterium]
MQKCPLTLDSEPFFVTLEAMHKKKLYHFPKFLSFMTISLFVTSCTSGDTGGPLNAADKPASSVNLQQLKEERVFTSEPCMEKDRPDAPANVFRDADGNIQLIATSNINHRQVGNSLEKLNRDCTVIFKGGQNADPAQHDNEGWIHGLYTEDGRTIYGLVHNEYWGSKFVPECNRNYNRCWWNDITWVKSIDGGKTYHLPPLEERVVAAFSYPYQPNVGRPVGFMNPSNILRKDDYLYAFIRSMGIKKQASGNFLIRKPVQTAWGNWEIWNGDGFKNIKELMKPGDGAVGKPIEVGRAPGFPNAAPMNVMSVVLHQPSGKYVAIMARGSRLAFKSKEYGFYLATSTDLINWSAPKQVMEANFECKSSVEGPQSFYRYYSLIDPSSKDRNFGTVTNNAYIYTTRITVDGCSSPKKLDLVRIPINLEFINEID